MIEVNVRRCLFGALIVLWVAGGLPVTASGPGHAGFPLVFIGYEGDDTLGIVEPIEFRELFAVLLGGPPYALAVSPDAQYLFATNGIRNTVDVVRLDTRRRSSVSVGAAAGSGPLRIAIPPQGHEVWLFGAGGSELLVRENPGLRALRTIRVDPGPSAIRFVSDGRTAFVTHEGSDRIAVIDVPTHTVRRWIELPAPGRAALHSDRWNRLYVLHEGSVSFVDFDAGSDPGSVYTRPLEASQPGLTDFGLNYYEDELWIVARGDSRLVILDATDLTEIGRVETTRDPSRMAFAPPQWSSDFRQWLFVTHEREDRVTKIDARERYVFGEISVGWGPRAITVNP